MGEAAAAAVKQAEAAVAAGAAAARAAGAAAVTPLASSSHASGSNRVTAESVTEQPPYVSPVLPPAAVSDLEACGAVLTPSDAGYRQVGGGTG